MATIDLLTQETIEIRTRNGLRRAPGHRFCDFAVHRSAEQWDLFRSLWKFTHLPTGRVVAGEFRTFDSAVDAMIEVARLRNDWAVIEDSELGDDMKEKIVAIVEKHGGCVGSRQDTQDRRPAYNGYSPAADHR